MCGVVLFRGMSREISEGVNKKNSTKSTCIQNENVLEEASTWKKLRDL